MWTPLKRSYYEERRGQSDIIYTRLIDCITQGFLSSGWRVAGAFEAIPPIHPDTFVPVSTILFRLGIPGRMKTILYYQLIILSRLLLPWQYPVRPGADVRADSSDELCRS